jgi:hypothetical protein
VTHFDHDHREREYVRLLAVFPLVPNFRCDPPRGPAILTRGTPSGVRVFGDLSEAKVRNAYMTRVFHEDVGLVGYERDVKQDGTITYSFEIPVYHTAGMKILEALGNVGQLATALCVRKS